MPSGPDREAAETLNAAMRELGAPDGRKAARENRAVLCRFVRYLAAEAGIRQFLDLGSGLPILGRNEEVHEVASRSSRTPVWCTSTTTRWWWCTAGRFSNRAACRPAAAAADPRPREEKRLLNLDQPAAVLLVAMLHCLADEEDPGGVVAQLRDAMVPGSCLALTHLISEAHPKGAALLREKVTELGMSTPLVPRRRDEIARFLEGLELVDPGLVYSELWRPDKPKRADKAGTAWMLAGLGRKPA